MYKNIMDVIAKSNEIIEKTKNFQRLNENCTEQKHREAYSELFKYFDDEFNDNEIMIIQSIMYFGRACYTGNGDEYKGSKEEVITRWMKYLGFSFDKKIEKDVQICEMVNKGKLIGSYFEAGFAELNRR